MTLAAASKILRQKKQMDVLSRRNQVVNADDYRHYDLMEFICHAGMQKFLPPTHLKELVDVIQESLVHSVRVLVSVPPRHGKTETLLRGIIWLLLRRPDFMIGYIGHTGHMAQSKSRSARDYALRVGLQLREDSTSVQEWHTVQGGGVLAQGVNGPLTGHGLQVLIVDDPHKDRKEAESPRIRQNIEEWFTSTALSRLTPSGSVIVCHARWHEDDLIGKLSSNDIIPWRVINLPVYKKNKQPLFLDGGWTREILEEKRLLLGPYDWSSLYLGEPRPRESRLFNNAYYYDELPNIGLRYAIGLDLAYSHDTSSDYSVAVVMACDRNNRMYILEVQRSKMDAPKFAGTLQLMKRRYAGARFFSIIGGTEKGVVDLLNASYGLQIQHIPAGGSKFVRAQQVAAHWNNGNIMLPGFKAGWVDEFLRELTNFSGIGDLHDDQVDALVNAYTCLNRSRFRLVDDKFIKMMPKARL